MIMQIILLEKELMLRADPLKQREDFLMQKVKGLSLGVLLLMPKAKIVKLLETILMQKELELLLEQTLKTSQENIMKKILIRIMFTSQVMETQMWIEKIFTLLIGMVMLGLLAILKLEVLAQTIQVQKKYLEMIQSSQWMICSVDTITFIPILRKDE